MTTKTETKRINASDLRDDDLLVSTTGPNLRVIRTYKHDDRLQYITLEGLGGWYASLTRVFTVEREVPGRVFGVGATVLGKSTISPYIRNREGKWYFASNWDNDMEDSGFNDDQINRFLDSFDYTLLYAGYGIDQ